MLCYFGRLPDYYYFCFWQKKCATVTCNRKGIKQWITSANTWLQHVEWGRMEKYCWSDYVNSGPNHLILNLKHGESKDMEQALTERVLALINQSWRARLGSLGS